jgi:hypothetical protein
LLESHQSQSDAMPAIFLWLGVLFFGDMLTFIGIPF